ncbi:hypothetical protein [Paenirhodobacter populi]|uniref:Porin n=1 Tax=Paenirhodobacter populi TaxID=2306993 RepID=A0A443JV17_9RHOB|nr:hypothetical protein [Sinirhodobacter populi]RWR10470.1 hypothetical protein D2T33_12485 [Sinirhodobacter populi]RWR24360.1 hypothetical protein D2T30_00105 [Sinirhodobacter populi]RWR31327.1 hypothetical protein D2T31_04825 [Sinirhodobacter populi]RWR31475.1 hypothetical protein D2T29_10600 [Sinirhodobacter populi]
MKQALAWALCATAALPGMAQAEITSAEIGLDYSTFGDADARDAHKATLGGALEFAITPQFAFQGDLAQRYYGFANWKGTTFTGHGIFHAGPDTAIGGFVGKDWLSHDNGGEFYGFEARQSLGPIAVEGYGLYFDGEKEDGYGVGLRGDYQLTNQLTVGGRFDTLNTDMGMPRLSATTSYEFAPGYAVNGELGYADPKNSDKEVFLTLGVKATFGPGQGVTFGGRGLQEILPGY